jgi:probable HAF family extracellular repeat protein
MKALTILLTLLVASAGAQQKKYITFSLGPNIYQQQSTVTAINDSGQVLGWSPANGDAYVISPGNVWTKNIIKVNGSWPLKMNNAATIVGRENPSNQPFYKPWEQPAVQFSFGNGTIASAINTAGYIAGVIPPSYFGLEEVYLMDPNNSFVHIAFPNNSVVVSGTMGLNNLNQIVGSWRDSSTPWSGFFYDSNSNKLNTTFNMPGVVSTYPVSINDNQEVVGNWIDANNVQHGFYWNPTAGFSDIDVAEDTEMELVGINNQSVILGAWLDDNTPMLVHYVTIVNGQPTASIRVPQSKTGSTVAAAINNVGQVVGEYQTQAGVWRGFIYTPPK